MAWTTVYNARLSKVAEIFGSLKTAISFQVGKFLKILLTYFSLVKLKTEIVESPKTLIINNLGLPTSAEPDHRNQIVIRGKIEDVRNDFSLVQVFYFDGLANTEILFQT